MFKLKASDGTNNICRANLIYYREEQGLSQRALALKLQVAGYDLDNHVIRRIENGERFVTDLEILALCDVLGIKPEELLKLK